MPSVFLPVLHRQARQGLLRRAVPQISGERQEMGSQEGVTPIPVEQICPKPPCVAPRKCWQYNYCWFYADPWEGNADD